MAAAVIRIESLFKVIVSVFCVDARQHRRRLIDRGKPRGQSRDRVSAEAD
jgi:hypothetical protein